MKKILLIISLVLIISTEAKAQIPATHFSIGYTFARSPLSDFNEFIGLYNENPVKLGNYTFTHGFDKMHWLTGVYFGGGFRFSNMDLELNFTRKFNHTFTYYDPANNPTYLRVDIGIGIATVEAAALFPTQYDKFTLSPGIGLGFLTRNLYYRADELLKNAPKRTDMISLEKSKSVSLDPMLQIAFRPFKNIPLDITGRLYYQMMFSRMSLENLYYNKGYWTPDESIEKNVSAGNLGLIVALRMNIPSFRPKLPERTPPPPAPRTESFLIGTVTDAQSGAILDAVVTFYVDSKPISSIVTKQGKYSIPTSPNSVYIIETKAFGYKTKTEKVTVPSEASELVSYDISLEKMAIGEAIKLENILFEKASAILLSESYPELDKLYKFLVGSPNVIIEIAGHTSSEGDDKYNLKLSQERAFAISNYLINKGISKSRIEAVGYGETKPLATNDTEEGRKLNRRVEFKILKM
jgi:outer membrane protein OmpA-like peptidoglycan-associated protein